MERDDRPVKISDVARIAGVSTATVSRVIHDNGLVSESTRRRVEDAVGQLGYQARRSPRQTASEKIVLLLTGDIVNPFFAEVIRGAQDEVILQKCVMNVMQLSTDHTKIIQAASQCAACAVAPP